MSKTITLCMIVRNEEKLLSRCLQSVKSKVNEIVIVDTGSTDATIEIARQYTNQIYHFKWIDDFSAARNESLKYANSEYILVLDADEYLNDDADLYLDLESSLDFYLLGIQNEMSFGRKFTHFAVRLFKNDERMRYENRLHEHLKITENSHEFKSGQGKTLIEHSGYTEETMMEKDKLKRNLPIMLKEVEENPTAYNLFNMAKTYLGIDKHDKAVQFFKRAYPLSNGKVFMPELLTKLAHSLGELKRFEEALLILQDAVHLFPNETEMKYTQGRLYLEAGYNRDAIECLHTCINLGDQGSVVTEGSGSYLAHFQLAELYEREGNLKESYRESLKVLQIKSNFVPGLKKYLEVALKANVSDEEVQQNVETLYSMQSIEDIQRMFNVLYGLRHPLLYHYLTKYNIEAQPHILSSAQIYSKNYNASRDSWNSLVSIEEESGRDILLLSVILKDGELFEKSQLNLSKKETQILKRIVLNQNINNIEIKTTSLENILIELSRQLIILQEFEFFQILAELIMKQNTKIKIRLCKVLSEYGYDEVAIDLLLKIFEEQSNTQDTIRLLGDLCYRNGYIDDAQLFYTKLLSIDPQYSSYERSYKLLENHNDPISAMNIKKEIAQRFPLANWSKKNS